MIPSRGTTAKNGMRRWRVFRFAGRPVIAVPDSPNLTEVALASLKPFTPKRVAYQRALRVATGLGLNRVFSTLTTQPLVDHPDFDVPAWLAEIEETLGLARLDAVLVWPPQRDRGRVYVHLIDHHARAHAFAKVSLSPANDDAIQREHAALVEMAKRNLQESRVPRVYTAARSQGFEFMVLEAIPEAARPLGASVEAFPMDAVEEYAGAPYRLKAGNWDSLSWWNRYSASAPDQRQFDDALRAAISHEGLRVRRVHGDFCRANLLGDHTRTWILDWEESCADGPAFLDELSFAMDVGFRWNASDPRGSVKRFQAQYLRGQEWQSRHAVHTADVLAAVAFMCSIGKVAATGLVQHWGD
ncbi:phosphotransferase [Agromyces sp. MMS24-JH15]|uniref:phosphotransferase n=1 Tax=Agromyces sp. MMS24-JH15 TaxID=3243765 RepID=UPI00374A5CEB